VTFSVDRIENESSASSQPLQPVPVNADRAAEAYNVEETIPAFDGGGADLLAPPQDPGVIAPLTNAVEPWPQLEFDLSMPSFFESIMRPEMSWLGAGEVQMPPDLDLTGVTPDYEEWSGTGDIFGYDFSTAFEQAMDTTNDIDGTTAAHGYNATNIDGAAGTDSSANSARQRYHVFKKSPW
jgi:hypothetical protein